jgi:hypothetical protein
LGVVKSREPIGSNDSSQQARAKVSPNALHAADTGAQPHCSQMDSLTCLQFMPDVGSHVIGEPRSAQLLPGRPGPRKTSFDSVNERRSLEFGKDSEDLKRVRPCGVAVSMPSWWRYKPTPRALSSPSRVSKSWATAQPPYVKVLDCPAQKVFGAANDAVAKTADIAR